MAASRSTPACRATNNRGSKHMPIDLTEDSPPRRGGVKRKLPYELNNASDSAPDQPQSHGPSPKKAKPREQEEQRLRRWRDAAPSTYYAVRGRALTQRMFVLDRQRDESYSDHPIETIKMAGTTGNMYTIVVDKVPTCDCPHAMKGNQCKHIVYVLSRVLRVPQHLEYQLAFVSSELRTIFSQAPPLPSKQADQSKNSGNRKPLEGECPICCDDFEPENTKEQIVYCKASCGNNIHEQCFDRWAKTKTGGEVACPFCRSPWTGETPSIKTLAAGGRVNGDGYVNVADQLGLSGERDYSSYSDFWLRRRGLGRYGC